MSKYSILILIFSLFLQANTLKESIQQDSFLSEGYTGFIEHEGINYLVSVGISTMEDDSIHSKINAIKVAKILALTELTKFIHQVKITSKEELVETTIITKEGHKIKHQYHEKFIETIKEESDGILRNIIKIGKWKKGNEYFFALGIATVK